MALERIVPDSSEAITLYAKHIARYMFTYNFIQNKEVLDVGCGCGYGTKYIADSNAKKVIGIDIAEEPIKYARAHYKKENLQYIVGDCKKIDLPDKSFDVIVAYELIEHLKEPEIFLDEMFRLLKENGAFIVSTPNKATFSPDTDIYDSPNEFHIREYYFDQFVDLLKKYHYKIEMYAEHSAPSYLRNDENTKIINENVKVINENIKKIDNKINDFRKEMIIEINLSTQKIADLILPKFIRRLIPKFIRNHFNKKLIIKDDVKRIRSIVNEGEIKNEINNTKLNNLQSGSVKQSNLMKKDLEFLQDTNLKIIHMIKGIKSPIMNWPDIHINQHDFEKSLYFIAICRK